MTTQISSISDDADIEAFYAEVTDPEPELPHIPKPLSAYRKKSEMMSEYSIKYYFKVMAEYPYRHFLTFFSSEHFEEYMYSLPEEQRCFHEIIMGNPRGLMVDIDDDHNTTPEQAPKVRQDLIETFITAFNEYYKDSAQIDSSGLVVVDSSGHSKLKDRYKFSLQIRTKHYATGRKGNLDFAQYFAKQLPNPEMVDLQIYTDYHCMRIPGCTKKDDGRNSRICVSKTYGQPTLRESYVGHHADQRILLPSRVDEKEPKKVDYSEVEIEDETINKILKMTKPYSEGYQFREMKGNTLFFDHAGISPECDICGRTHDNDNVFFISLQGNNVMRGCWRAPRNTIKIGELQASEVTLQAPVFKKLAPHELMAKLIERPLPQQTSITRPKYVTADYKQETMKDYPSPSGDFSTLVIKAGKGVGKTEALVKHLLKHYDNAVMVALSHRETFAAELSRQLPGFAVYKQVKESRISLIDHSRVIVQMESLHRLDFDDLTNQNGRVNLLILDESESILSQLSSKLFRRFNEAWANFDWLIKFSEHIIALDAHISDRTLDLLVNRQGPKSFITNTYIRPGHTDKLAVDEDTWRTALFDDVAKGKKIVCATNSASEARAIEATIRKQFTAKTVKIYTGETSRQEKADDIANIANEWKVDVLIYSPTITSGVSFKEKHFDRLYGFFRVGSCPAADCDQMLGRVRDIADKQGVIYIDMKATECKLTKAQIRDQVLKSRNNTLAQYDISKLCFHYNANYEKEVLNKEYFNIWLDNEVLQNRSRSQLARELVAIFQSNGATLELLTLAPGVTSGLEAISEKVTEVKQNIIKDRHEAVARAPLLTDEAAKKLHEKIDLTPDERAQLRKHALVKIYAVDPAIITTEWCQEYNDPKVIGLYKSLSTINKLSDMCDMTSAQKLEEGLREIQKREADLLKETSESPATWNANLYFDRHRIAIEFMRKCGFMSLQDQRVVARDDLERAIRYHSKYFGDTFDHVKATFRTRGKRPDFLKGPLKACLEYINSVLSCQYGVRISTEGKCQGRPTDKYGIRHHHNFDVVNFRPVHTAQSVKTTDINEFTEAEEAWINELINE